MAVERGVFSVVLNDGGEFGAQAFDGGDGVRCPEDRRSGHKDVSTGIPRSWLIVIVNSASKGSPLARIATTSVRFDNSEPSPASK